MACFAHRGGGQAHWRAARSVQADDILGAGGREQDKAIATDPGHLRLANSQQNRTRYGRIHGIAA